MSIITSSGESSTTVFLLIFIINIYNLNFLYKIDYWGNIYICYRIAIN